MLSGGELTIPVDILRKEYDKGNFMESDSRFEDWICLCTGRRTREWRIRRECLLGLTYVEIVRCMTSPIISDIIGCSYSFTLEEHVIFKKTDNRCRHWRFIAIKSMKTEADDLL